MSVPAPRQDWFRGRTYSRTEIAEAMGISRTRVRQIEERALKKIRDALSRDQQLRRALLMEIDSCEE